MRGKIFIVGIVASGKTTLAKRLSAHLHIPCYELDGLVHVKEGHQRIKRTPEALKKVITAIDQQGNWILEGTDRAAYQYLYEWADTIIFMDPPLWKRKIRIVTRYLKQITGREQALYTPNRQMLVNMFRWTKDFERGRNDFESKLKRHGDKVTIIRNDRETTALFKCFKASD